ncbi:MAG TPA: hypothetical protein VII01_16790 [Solirubrobacteraceae bacterium]|jgi:hypothetical protein
MPGLRSSGPRRVVGDRRSAIFGDYRPNWSIGEADATRQAGAPVAIDSAERIEPGETADVRLFPMWAEFWVGVSIGTQLFAFEGVHLVGSAVVTQTVGPVLS